MAVCQQPTLNDELDTMSLDTLLNKSLPTLTKYEMDCVSRFLWTKPGLTGALRKLVAQHWE